MVKYFTYHNVTTGPRGDNQEGHTKAQTHGRRHLRMDVVIDLPLYTRSADPISLVHGWCRCPRVVKKLPALVVIEDKSGLLVHFRMGLQFIKDFGCEGLTGGRMVRCVLRHVRGGDNPAHLRQCPAGHVLLESTDGVWLARHAPVKELIARSGLLETRKPRKGIVVKVIDALINSP